MTTRAIIESIVSTGRKSTESEKVYYMALQKLIPKMTGKQVHAYWYVRIIICYETTSKRAKADYSFVDPLDVFMESIHPWYEEYYCWWKNEVFNTDNHKLTPSMAATAFAKRIGGYEAITRDEKYALFSSMGTTKVYTEDERFAIANLQSALNHNDQKSVDYELMTVLDLLIENVKKERKTK
jgi:hypothetical protein